MSSIRTVSSGKRACLTLLLSLIHIYSEGIVNYALEVAGVEAAVFLRQRGGGYKISLRSAGELDVADIASQFGGGGHRLAAGCTVNGELDQVKDRIIQMIAQKAGYDDGN